jgi:cytochrome c
MTPTHIGRAPRISGDPAAPALSQAGRSTALKRPVAHALAWTIAVALIIGVTAAHAQDAQHGQQVFQQCTVCHTLDPSGSSLGPSLRGVVNRKAGSLPGFRYSNAMSRAGFAWTAANLDAYLRDPQAKVPGNHMPFSGLPADKDRADLIAYLQTLK